MARMEMIWTIKSLMQAVYFYNQQYWEITSLEITNRIPGDNPEDHIKKYGVTYYGKRCGDIGAYVL
ncbi:MAG: hypothetical protein ACLRMN_03415 [Mediterraneibacter gnavus]